MHHLEILLFLICIFTVFTAIVNCRAMVLALSAKITVRIKGSADLPGW